MSLTDPFVDSRVFQLAVAGAGVIGRRHIELIQASPRTRLCAVVDPTPAPVEFAASLGVPHFFSLQDLLAQPPNQRPDGVILATPNHLHVPGALLCAQHGVPALIEKPVADSLQAGQQLADALARQSTPMLVGHHRRHSSTLQLARRTIQSGQLGRVVTVMGSAQFYKPDSYFEQAAWRREAGGGPILINLIHEMDNLRYLCGEVEAVHAVASNAVRQFAVEDSVVMTLKFSSGAPSRCQTRWRRRAAGSKPRVKTPPTRATRPRTATSSPARRARWRCPPCAPGLIRPADGNPAGARLLPSKRWPSPPPIRWRRNSITFAM